MLFNNEAEGSVAERLTMASAPFGERIDSLGRYKLPLLPGESGTKSGGDWVPFGVQSATNLAGSIVESRQLGIWERRKTQIGLALRPDLAEQQAILINKALLNGFNFAESRLQGEGSTAEGNAIAVELDRIHAEAKQSAGGNLAAQRGTNRHDVWEARAQTGHLLGTPAVNEQIERLEQLLEEKHLRRVPGLQERVVRNVALRAAGKFDDVLQTTENIYFPSVGEVPGVIPAGTLLMADLKTKQRSYYSWLEVRIQLAVYATAEWMLADHPLGGLGYAPGPKTRVNQQWGVVLWAPSNGEPPQLKRCNIVKGFAHAQLARAVCDARSEAKNVAAHGEAMW
jgi:hypothetical protein